MSSRHFISSELKIEFSRSCPHQTWQASWTNLFPLFTRPHTVGHYQPINERKCLHDEPNSLFLVAFVIELRTGGESERERESGVTNGDQCTSWRARSRTFKLGGLTEFELAAAIY